MRWQIVANEFRYLVVPDLPVLGREVVEGEQGVAILDQALDRFVVFDAPGLDEGVETPRVTAGVARARDAILPRLAGFDQCRADALRRAHQMSCTGGQQVQPRVELVPQGGGKGHFSGGVPCAVNQVPESETVNGHGADRQTKDLMP